MTGRQKVPRLSVHDGRMERITLDPGVSDLASETPERSAPAASPPKADDHLATLRSSAASPMVEDHLAALRSLGAMRDTSLITSEEYEAKKADILARL
jgi:hypothetical protein